MMTSMGSGKWTPKETGAQRAATEEWEWEWKVVFGCGTLEISSSGAPSRKICVESSVAPHGGSHWDDWKRWNPRANKSDFNEKKKSKQAQSTITTANHIDYNEWNKSAIKSFHNYTRNGMFCHSAELVWVCLCARVYHFRW
jgi:hypothetical protein